MKKNEKDRLIFLGYIAVVIASFLLGLFPTVTKPVISSVNPLFFSSIVGVAPFIIFTPVLVSTSRRTPKVKVEEQRPLARNTQRAIFGIVLIRLVHRWDRRADLLLFRLAGDYRGRCFASC